MDQSQFTAPYNGLKRKLIPLGFLALFLMSLFLPYDKTMDNAWGVQDTGWLVNFGYLFGRESLPSAPRASWYSQAIAFVIFALLAVLFLIFRKWNVKIHYAMATIAALSWAFLETPYFRPILFKTGFDKNMVGFYLRSMTSGYYLSLLFALAIVVWMFWATRKRQSK